jgi:hypothetical protein
VWTIAAAPVDGAVQNRPAKKRRRNRDTITPGQLHLVATIALIDTIGSDRFGHDRQIRFQHVPLGIRDHRATLQQLL